MESATTRNVLHILLPSPFAISQNYDCDPAETGREGEGGKYFHPHTSPLRKRCKVPQWGPGRSPDGDLTIYNVLWAYKVAQNLGEPDPLVIGHLRNCQRCK